MMFDRRAKFAFIAACVLLLAGSVGLQYAVSALNIYLKKEPVEMRKIFTVIPTALGEWRMLSQDQVLGVEMVEELGTDKYLNRVYAIDGDPRKGMVSLHLAFYTGMIDAVPHVPDRCMIAAGYEFRTMPRNYPLPIDRQGWSTEGSPINVATGLPYPRARDQVYVDRLMPLGDFEIRVTEFQDPKQPERRIFGGYFFIANGRVTATPETVRALAFKPSEKYAYFCKVQLVGDSDSMTVDSFQALAGDFVTDLLPSLMECLPVWSEVERWESPAPRMDVASD
jgi:hypothetical protein